MVEADCQPYTYCCFFLSVLIFKSYYENNQLYRYLECGTKISEVIIVKEISDLYSKLGFEKFQNISNDDFQYTVEPCCMTTLLIRPLFSSRIRVNFFLT